MHTLSASIKRAGPFGDQSLLADFPGDFGFSINLFYSDAKDWNAG